MKTTKERIRAHSLVRNTSRVRRVCWSSKMGTKKNDKCVNYSYQSAQTKQQAGQCIVGTFLCTHEPQPFTHSQNSPQHGLGGSHNLPPYSILCDSPQGYTQMVFFAKIPNQESRNSQNWDSHHFGCPQFRLKTFD